MKSTHLKIWSSKIDNIITKSKALSSGDPELESYLASHLVVFAAGAYEDCIEFLLAQRAQKSRDVELISYVERTIDIYFRNPDFSNICKMLVRFNPQWVKELEKRVDAKAAQGINSIVGQKNNIAHGKPSSVTLSDFQDFHRRAVSVLEALEEVLT